MGPQHRTLCPRTGAFASLCTLSGVAGIQHFPATVLGMDGKFLTMQCEAPVASGTPVRVDVEGGLLLGEVVCSDAGGSRETRIEIDQIIPSLPDVVKLVRAVMGEGGTEEVRRRSDTVTATTKAGVAVLQY